MVWRRNTCADSVKFKKNRIINRYWMLDAGCWTIEDRGWRMEERK
jgi:hypothetical protein